jgi:hypothetical protein
MQKRIVGFVLALLGFSGMALAGYIFVTGTGGRGHLLEVTSYMIAGAVCFFYGINYVYDSYSSFTERKGVDIPEFEEVSELQEQWRTIQISKQPVSQPATQMSMSEA